MPQNNASNQNSNFGNQNSGNLNGNNFLDFDGLNNNNSAKQNPKPDLDIFADEPSNNSGPQIQTQGKAGNDIFSTGGNDPFSGFDVSGFNNQNSGGNQQQQSEPVDLLAATPFD